MNRQHSALSFTSLRQRDRYALGTLLTRVLLLGLWFAPAGWAESTPSPRIRPETISTGYSYTCGIKSDGTVACWGNNSSGQATPPAGTFIQISAAGMGSHTCGVKSNGTVACWGGNTYGKATPPVGTFTQVSAGDYHTCGVKSDGSVACWGDNAWGQATPPAGIFIQVSADERYTCGVRSDGSVACWGYAVPSPAETFTQVSAAWQHTCGVRSDGTVACWGGPSSQTTPPAGTFIQISAGGDYTCGVKSNGSIACWGWNSATPPAGTFIQVSAGGDHACGLKNDGSVVCWGDNTYGQSTPPAGTFKKSIITSTLTVTMTGSGTGTVTSVPSGINCGSDCTENYDSGTMVTLKATPASGSAFTGWGGACTGTGPCQVTMTQTRAVTATFALLPGKATLLEPTGVIGNDTPTYHWQAVAGSTWYYLWVNDAQGTRLKQWYPAAQAGCASGTGDCTISPPMALHNGAGKWWVQTWNAAGAGPWSEPMPFTVSVLVPPGKAILVAPNGSLNEDTPSYQWQVVAEATWYYLWVDDAQGTRLQQWYTAAQAGCESGNGVCTVTPETNLRRNGAGQWRLQTWNAAGAGPWSEAMNFTLAAVKPDAATLIAPSGTVTTATPSYRWQAMANVSWYYLWVNDAQGTRLKQWYTATQAGCAAGTGTCTVTPTTAVNKGAGQWWIQTWNAAGYGPWSQGMTFTRP